MVTIVPPCQLTDTPGACNIELRGEINIVQAATLKDLALKAVDLKKNIRVDMSDLEELDIAIIQLLCATKKTTEESGLDFSISPISDDAKTLISVSGVAHELLP